MVPILLIEKLGFPFETDDPFLFCAHHKDVYPKGDANLAPAVPLTGRSLGNDFVVKDGFRMYHGRNAPGFPEHPHRGFETVTVTLRGYVDHSDSLGTSGRYGNGDVQWMTAGSGCQHAEMFPLIHQNQDNPLEFFQIWLNLAKKDKFTEPYYKMLWAEDIPDLLVTDAHGKKSMVRLVAGSYQGVRAPAPSPASWANVAEHHVRILVIRMDPEATIVLPRVSASLSRNLYFYEGSGLTIEDTRIPPYSRVKLTGDADVTITAGSEKCLMLILEGEPLGEPVARYGPFVMNTQQEIQEAFSDYRKTGFGGWPWPVSDPVHATGENRFAAYANGERETRGPTPPVR